MSHTWRTIEMTLERKSIERAIREIDECRKQLAEAMNELIRELAEQGANVAKMNVADFNAVDSGELQGSIYGYYDPESRIGYIIAGAAHAFYVEYGTGVVGAENPHPNPAGWEYDVNGHGEKGWWYDKCGNNVFSGDGSYYWTRGMPSRPFMYQTMMWLEQAAEALGKKILT